MKSPSRRATRRQFLATTAGIVGAPYVIPPNALGQGDAEAPSERVTIGLIGCGGRGSGVFRGLIGAGGQPIAFSDPAVLPTLSRAPAPSPTQRWAKPGRSTTASGST